MRLIFHLLVRDIHFLWQLVNVPSSGHILFAFLAGIAADGALNVFELTIAHK